MSEKKIIIYKSKDGNIEIKVNLENDTVWLNSNQIGLIFDVDRSVIEKHIKNIYLTQELEEKLSCAKNAQVQKEGKRMVKREKKFYNLDMIISIGYRINSHKATRFRIWANKILKEYMINGFVLNQKTINQNKIEELKQTLNIIKKSLNNLENKDEAIGIVEIISKYIDTWILLNQFDKNELEVSSFTQEMKFKINHQYALKALISLKKELLLKNEANELFALEREKNNLEAILGNIYQTFGGMELYPTVEEKIANLLYLVIKDHPFVDGNKRSGAFLFILFLSKNGLLKSKGETKINDRGLVALTLLIAQSDPKDKEIMIKLIINLLK